MRVTLAKSFTFEAAHYLPCFPDGHKCRRMHGHSFKVEVVVEGEMDPAKGYLVDYGDIKKAISPVHDALDHRCLNEVRASRIRPRRCWRSGCGTGSSRRFPCWRR